MTQEADLLDACKRFLQHRDKSADLAGHALYDMDQIVRQWRPDDTDTLIDTARTEAYGDGYSAGYDEGYKNGYENGMEAMK